MNVDPALAAGVTALVAAIIRYVEKRRVTRGNVSTTEASELWDVQERERLYLRQELDSVRAELLRCRASNHMLRNEILKLQMVIEVPEIPQETIDRIMANSQIHISSLLDEAIRLDRASGSTRKSDPDDSDD